MCSYTDGRHIENTTATMALETKTLIENLWYLSSISVCFDPLGQNQIQANVWARKNFHNQYWETLFCAVPQYHRSVRFHRSHLLHLYLRMSKERLHSIQLLYSRKVQERDKRYISLTQTYWILLELTQWVEVRIRTRAQMHDSFRAGSQPSGWWDT